MRRLSLLLCLLTVAFVVSVDGSWGATGGGRRATTRREHGGDERRAVLGEIRHWSNPDYTRVAISVDHETTYEHHRLQGDTREGKPSRLYLDIHRCRLPGRTTPIPVGDGLLRQIRVAQHTPDTVRVVIDLESIRDFKVFTFSDPFRIIVDFRGEQRQEVKALPPVVVAQQPPARLAADAGVDRGRMSPPEAAAPPSRRHERRETERRAPPPVRRIVVDPGHGGHDPGAVGRNGTREKDVVLDIALELSRILTTEHGLDVVMTRSTDVFVELQERTAIANKVGADLFVSVHANAAPNRNATGIETYYLNLAKTEKVAQLAALENGTSLEKVSLLQAVLFDLMATYKLNDSAHLAEDVQKALVRRVAASYPSVRNLGVKQGPFYVLVGATMPSILVETAFISNAAEEERLADPAYRKATAAGIADGIAAYMASLSRGERR